MSTLVDVLEGLFVAHLFLLVFFVVGAAAFPWCEWEPLGRPPRTMVRLICTMALGMSLTGLAMFVLGLVGWLSAPYICVAIVILVAGCSAAWRSSPLRLEYWRLRWGVLRRCWDGPLAAIYLLMLVLACRAILPNIGDSDPVWYHLAYAQDWVQAGRIVVDPYLVFPFFANNFLLFFAAAILFHAAAFVNFVVWAMALFVALGVYAVVCDEDDGERAPWWRAVIALFAALSVIGTTIFLDLSVQGYADVPLSAAAFASVASILLALRERRLGWLLAAAAIAGFTIGMKGSFVLLGPIYAVALVWVARALKLERPAIVAVLVILCAVGAPWYVRNLVVAGDPIAPVINLALYHDDGLISQSEWDALENDLGTHRSPTALLTLPLRAYWDPDSPDFREYGVTLLIALVYVPSLVWLALLAARKPVRPIIAIPIFVLTGFVLYWIVTSTLLRYSLLFYPLLAVCVAFLAIAMGRRWPRLVPLAMALVVATALPSPGDGWVIKSFLHDDLERDYKIVGNGYPGDRAYLRKYESGYREEEFLSAWMRQRGYDGNVYVIGQHLDYYFRAAGVRGIGDFTGPAGYFRLLKAIDVGRAVEFLDDLDVHAIMMRPNQLIDDGLIALLAKQLVRGGFTEVRLPKGKYRIFVRAG